MVPNTKPSAHRTVAWTRFGTDQTSMDVYDYDHSISYLLFVSFGTNALKYNDQILVIVRESVPLFNLKNIKSCHLCISYLLP